MGKISKKTLEIVYKEFVPGTSFEDLYKQLERVEAEQKEIIKQEKIKKEFEASKTIVLDSYYIIENDENQEIDLFLEYQVDIMDWDSKFYEGDGIPDDGVDGEEYFLIDGKLYLVSLHCEANWVGDWSVRKNLPGDVNITNFYEIKDFDVIEKIGESIRIKIK